jgi:hypothetical protein
MNLFSAITSIHSLSTRGKTLLSLLAVLVLCGATISNAQQIIVNSSGNRVVIYPDGTWRAYEEADSVLLKRQLSKEEVYRKDKPPVIYENTSDNPEEIRAMMEVSNQFADLTMRQSREANRATAKALDAKFEVEARLKQAQENKNFIEPDKLGSLEDEFDQKIEVVKTARKHQKQTTKFAEEAQGLLAMSLEKREKTLNKLMVSHAAYYTNRDDRVAMDTGYVPAGATSTQAYGKQTSGISSEKTKKSSSSTTDSNSKYASYKRQPVACVAVRNEVNDKGKPQQIVIERKVIFWHTDDDLRPYFRDQELVTCTGQLSQLDDNVYVTIEFSIASPNAQKNFGALAEGSLLRLRLLDGTNIDLHNLQGDRGHIDAYSGNTIFIGRYYLQKDQQRTLAKNELNKMRVVWNTGYEDYSIYAVDFMIEQFKCLKNYQ